jgi:hypothetical protein
VFVNNNLYEHVIIFKYFNPSRKTVYFCVLSVVYKLRKWARNGTEKENVQPAVDLCQMSNNVDNI